MTTARDLALVTLGLPPDRPVEQGDLSLVLAGAEALDLLESGALTLDGDRMVPGLRVTTGDRLLDQALASLVRREPYETVGDWLWRRGARLAAAYAEDLERAGLIVPPRGIGFWSRFTRTAPADSPERRRAEERRASGEPVLAALTAFLRTGDASSDDCRSLDGDAANAVLAAVGDAVTELEAVRLCRDVEGSAFDNIWRG
ncbi:GPP34 family phosphoprotein [Streptomyces sp. Ncost-T10-10d]|uniref:GPP34 family phosphoprotein n=1 Tax=Streptomyces sp. Ncost-T10-10d TaxID=1839774 RepID=UPI00081DC899|nr:GPP34 family phosphoprotein [Streptomyces sp. Ncost-T10-10d]SCF64934.1 Golgi phosphoprotein 3 (GPP34) [Streptomyces sp. Ncost-T10-10d]